MGDWRRQGHAIRRREGAPSSHSEAAHLPSDYGFKSWREEDASAPIPGQKDIPDAGYMHDANDYGTDV
jgi:hypothetical protein